MKTLEFTKFHVAQETVDINILDKLGFKEYSNKKNINTRVID
jgi:hypothetical protein